jgi:hypothetical protein
VDQHNKLIDVVDREEKYLDRLNQISNYVCSMYRALLPGCVTCLLAPIGTTSAGPRGCRGAAAGPAGPSGDGDSLASGQPERAGGGRAAGVGHGGDGPGGGGMRAGAIARSRHEHWWARGPGGPGDTGANFRPKKRAGGLAVPGPTARTVHPISISDSLGALVCTVCTECAHSKCAQIFFGPSLKVIPTVVHKNVSRKIADAAALITKDARLLMLQPKCVLALAAVHRAPRRTAMAESDFHGKIDIFLAR